MENVVLAEEFARAKAPLRADFFGDTLVGPTILQWGTEEQKKEFLPKILNGEMAWCQGFSEPNSGSDLASLKTTAVRDGDEWVISGQKVWTTQAQFADYCFLLARTNPDATKHKGISYLLVPMKQDGIEVRGITQPDGTAEFNEVFFDGARCPIDNVVGGIDNGWVVANTTLSHERGMSATTGYRRFAQELDLMVGQAKANGRIDDPLDPPGPGPLPHQDPDPPHQRAAQPHRDASTSGRTRRSPRSGPRTRCSGRRCTATPWSSPSRSSGRRRCSTTPSPRTAAWPATARSKGREGYPVSQMMSAFFFSRSRDDLGRHRRDPAQHRGRAGPRPAPGTEATDVLTPAGCARSWPERPVA